MNARPMWLRGELAMHSDRGTELIRAADYLQADTSEGPVDLDLTGAQLVDQLADAGWIRSAGKRGHIRLTVPRQELEDRLVAGFLNGLRWLEDAGLIPSGEEPTP